MNPPLEIPAKATAARAFIHSATVPFVFPNVVSGKNGLRVLIPTKDLTEHNLGSGMREVTITVPVGLYSLDPAQGLSLADMINARVNAFIRSDNQQGANAIEKNELVDHEGKNNFCTITPNFIINRAEITFNHAFTGIDFTHAESTLDILGFTERCVNEREVFSAAPAPFQLSLTFTCVSRQNHGLALTSLDEPQRVWSSLAGPGRALLGHAY